MIMAVNAFTFVADDPPYPLMEPIGMEIVLISSTEEYISILDSLIERAFAYLKIMYLMHNMRATISDDVTEKGPCIL